MTDLFEYTTPALWQLWGVCTVFVALIIAARWHTNKDRKNRNDDMIMWVVLYLLCSLLFLLFAPFVFYHKIGG